jgi:hypothetical protein
MKMTTERWWKENDRGKPNYSEQNQFQHHFALHKSQINGLDRERNLGLRDDRPKFIQVKFKHSARTSQYLTVQTNPVNAVVKIIAIYYTNQVRHTHM